MKLIIQIPCLNEEQSLPETLAALPRAVPGFDCVEWLVVDDGSTDRTVDVARALGVDHIVQHQGHLGLARAFMNGIEACLKAGADVIVNTDADNQYRGEDIPALVAPILAGKAQMVIGARPIFANPDFSLAKKCLQALGSWVVRMASATRVPDAPSGFRAYHRGAALRMFVLGSYTYTLETIIQAGRKNIAIASVPVGVNRVSRPSRLMKSGASYISRSVITILRIFVLYKPLRFFTLIAALLAVPGIVGVARFLVLYAVGSGNGHVQSLVLSGVLLALAAIVQIGGLLADLVAANRMLLEDIRFRQLRGEVEDGAIAPTSARSELKVLRVAN